MAKKALLAALMLILALAAPAWAQKAQKGDKAPTPVGSSGKSSGDPKEIRDFGSRWTAMTEKEKTAFVEGMATSFRIICLNAAMGGEAKPKDTKEFEQRFVECLINWMPYKTFEVSAAMTSIYQDKANNILSWDMIYGQALLKIKGAPYEDNLKVLRQSANAVAKEMK